MKRDKPVKGNTKSEKQAVNAPFEKKIDFNFKVNLVEETIPNDCNVKNQRTVNGKSGIDTGQKLTALIKYT